MAGLTRIVILRLALLPAEGPVQLAGSTEVLQRQRAAPQDDKILPWKNSVRAFQHSYAHYETGLDFPALASSVDVHEGEG